MQIKPLISIGGLSLLLASCSTIIPPGTNIPVSVPAAETAAKPIGSVAREPLPAPEQPGDGTTSASLGVQLGPNAGELGINDQDASDALAAFITSCRSVIWRKDVSGLTEGADWREPCDAAKTWNDDAVSFFATQLVAVQVGDGRSFATGYFEPEIEGSREKIAGFDVPIYAKPDDLLTIPSEDLSQEDLARFNVESVSAKTVRGKRFGEDGYTLYEDRAEIENGSLEGRGLEIAWAKDPIDFFFLQIQGSGRLRAPDGTIMRIGYASQNGHDYTGIGRLMNERGLLAPGEASLQGITAWLRRNPEEGRKIMQENKSYVFFQELTGAGPLGALGLPVVAESSVAADPKFTPLGAPVWISMDRSEPNGMWIAQDTGGAIKGANRFDTFWGAGERAKAISGGMAARGSALLFLPNASVERLGLNSESLDQ